MVDLKQFKCFNNIELHNIEIIKEKNLIRFIANSKIVIDFREIENAIKTIENSYMNKINVEIDINYNIEDKSDEFIKLLKSNIMYIIEKKSTACARCCKIVIENNNIYIIVNNNLLYNKIKDIIKQLEIEKIINNLYSTNFIFSINLKEEKTNTFTDEIDNEVKKIIEESKNVKKSESINTSVFKAESTEEKRKFKHNIKDEKKFDVLEITYIKDITNDTGEVHIKGEVIKKDKIITKNEKVIITLTITDFTDTIVAKYFCPENVNPESILGLKGVEIIGNAGYDPYSKEETIVIRAIKEAEIVKLNRSDKSEDKRVELHLHTSMSAMDGINSFSEYYNLAKKWGHKALAITDHGVVQGFPNAMDATIKDNDFKVLYGMEGYLIDDGASILNGCENKNLDSTIVVFDIETTGFNAKKDDIIEIGAVKIKNRKIIDTYNTFVFTPMKLPDKIIELTGIKDEMLVDAPKINEVLTGFKEFIGDDSILVAHNASFDVKFIKEKNLVCFGERYEMPVIDTLELSRALVKGVKNYKLDTLTKKFDISLENHHRAVDDAKATAFLLLKLYEIIENMGIFEFKGLNDNLKSKVDNSKKISNHVIILAKNLNGLKDLYKLVSKAHINLFYKNPRILKSDLNNVRQGLIIGSACEAGELYRAILNGESDDKIEKIAEFYDFLEIQPIANNEFLIKKELVKSREELKDINRKIVELGKKLNKLVVATGDVHFLNPEDEIYRKILMKGLKFGDAEEQAPLYLKSTDEMLDEFSYLGIDVAYEVVVKNTNIISDSIDKIIPIPDGTYPPEIEGANEDFRRISFERAHSIYGDPLPKIVEERLERELNSIIDNGYAVMYMIAQKLVKKSNDDGYIVGSRGSVGSSFAATMSGISEVNPLSPHYVCKKCKYSEFFTDGQYGSGVDLPDKSCPVCGEKLGKDGHEIPFEVFLGFHGDKEPDIDLNFAAAEQSVAMKYTEELFGKGNVYRAGTIGTIADKTAYGFVKNYYEEKGIPKRNAEIDRIIQGCLGVKRTSGQHPGGVMVVPKYKDIHDFTPIQYPANNEKAGSITTHFDYHSISGRILKLDLLGHDTPTIIRMLEEFTGIKDKDVPLDDSKTMSIFSSPDVLGVSKEDIDCELGTLAIPEFGTNFVRKMVLETKPTTFSDLLRISGLSHGTDVWVGNAQDLILSGTCKINEVIATRDDIMTYLIQKGVDKKQSFDIMEKVRKGKGLKEEDEIAMKECDVPQWYIDSCNKIKYMFPKAHAVAYVMMAMKIAYFKVHYPEAFYAAYFTMKVADFDADIISKGVDSIENVMKSISEKGNDKTTKEKDAYTVLEVAREMYKRGYICHKVDLYDSDDMKFKVIKGGILPPLVGLQGLGENAAKSIKEKRAEGEFISVEDIVNKTKVTKTVIEVLEKHGCLDNMEKTNQLTLFNI